MPAFHYPLGGSTAARTINCPGWYQASKDAPKQPASPPAVEGSMHHEIMEMCQRQEKEPEDFIGHVYEEGDGQTRGFTQDDLALSKKAFSTTNALLDELEIDEMIIEPLVELVPELSGGSIDLIGLSEDRDTVLVLDYKFGRHIVSADHNAQGMFYALAASEDEKTRDMFDEASTLEIAIVQPQSKHGVSRWSTDMKTLLEYETTYRKALDLSQLDDAPRKTGDWCKYCPAAPRCPTALENAGAMAQLTAKSDNELSIAAANVLVVEEWVKSVKEEIYLTLKRGTPVEGWKLVNKRASRKWIDPAAAEEYLKKKRVPQRLFRNNSFRTAPQVVDALKKEGKKVSLEDYIEIKSSGTTAAPASSEEEEVGLSAVPENLAKHIADKT